MARKKDVPFGCALITFTFVLIAITVALTAFVVSLIMRHGH